MQLNQTLPDPKGTVGFGLAVDRESVIFIRAGDLATIDKCLDRKVTG